MAGGHTILVIDDEVEVVKSVKNLLRLDYNVLGATSADEAMEILAREPVHVIMTDQRMPKVTGVELLTQVRQGHPQAVRMLFTGYSDLDSIIAAINQGHIFKFMKKPWQPADLEEAVREAALEFDRLVEQGEEMGRLRSELQHLRDRLAALEEEVRRLKVSKTT